MHHGLESEMTGDYRTGWRIWDQVELQSFKLFCCAWGTFKTSNYLGSVFLGTLANSCFFGMHAPGSRDAHFCFFFPVVQ